MKDVCFTLTGTRYHFGNDFIKPGMEIKLRKEPDNSFDREAIAVYLEGLGCIGYVANSVNTVLGESLSAGRLYDRIGRKAGAKVLLKTDKGIICKVKKKDLK